MQIDTFVLGGLPVTVEFNVCGPDRDVGIFSSWVDEWYFVAVNGRAVKGAAWIERRMTKADLDKLNEELCEAANEPDDDYDDYRDY